MPAHFRETPFHHVAVSTIASIVLCLTVSQTAAADDDSFANKIAGTWLLDPGSEFQVLMNIHADGTLIWSNSVEYFPAFPNGAVFGVWKRTGKREITTAELGFLYDENGVHIITGKVEQVFTFDKKFQSLTGQFTEDLFDAAQNPIDPSEDPFFTFGGDGIQGLRLVNLAEGDFEDDDN